MALLLPGMQQQGAGLLMNPNMGMQQLMPQQPMPQIAMPAAVPAAVPAEPERSLVPQAGGWRDMLMRFGTGMLSANQPGAGFRGALAGGVGGLQQAISAQQQREHAEALRQQKLAQEQATAQAKAQAERQAMLEKREYEEGLWGRQKQREMELSLEKERALMPLKEKVAAAGASRVSVMTGKTGDIDKSQTIAGEFIKPAGIQLSPAEVSEIRKTSRSLSNFENAAQNYTKTVQEVGPQLEVMGFGADQKKLTKLNSAYKDITTEAKNLFELGALSGPDMDLIEGWMVNPTSVEAQRLGKEGLIENSQRALEKIKAAKGNLATAYDLQIKNGNQQPARQAPQQAQGFDALWESL